MHFDNPWPWMYGMATGAILIGGPLAYALGLWPLYALMVFAWIAMRGIERRRRRILPDAIAHLRAFGDDRANQAFCDRVEPILVCCGTLYSVVAKQNIQLDPVSRFVNKLRRTPGRYGVLEVEEKEHWRQCVEKLLKGVKLAVIDVSTLSESVRWEMSAAIEILGRERVILLSGGAGEELGGRFEGTTSLLYHSPTLERDLAFLVQELVGLPPLLKKEALMAYLLNGKSRAFYCWLGLFLLMADLQEGVRFSRIKGLRLASRG